jgi:hypothetical protein
VRLLQAVARVYSPDRADRRRMAKAAARDRRAQRVKQAEETLAETGIRTLRQKPIYHSPNVFPPREFEQRDVESESTAYRATEEVQCCYVCKESYSHIHHFYDQMCPACAELNFKKRTELADLRGRVAVLTGGRVKIGYQAGLNCSARAPTSLSRPAFRGIRPPGTRASAISANGAIGSRSSASI